MIQELILAVILAIITGVLISRFVLIYRKRKIENPKIILEELKKKKKIYLTDGRKIEVYNNINSLYNNINSQLKDNTLKSEAGTPVKSSGISVRKTSLGAVDTPDTQKNENRNSKTG